MFSAALEVTQRIIENKDDWSTLFKPSDFFQKYKYATHTYSSEQSLCNGPASVLSVDCCGSML